MSTNNMNKNYTNSLKGVIVCQKLDKTLTKTMESIIIDNNESEKPTNSLQMKKICLRNLDILSRSSIEEQD